MKRVSKRMLMMPIVEQVLRQIRLNCREQHLHYLMLCRPEKQERLHLIQMEVSQTAQHSLTSISSLDGVHLIFGESVATRDGYVFKGWQIKGGTGNFILPGMVVADDFVAIAAWIRQGWVYENQSWYYYDTAGKITTGWSVVDGVWYYFDENGIMQTGWQLIDGDWYYLNASGAMQVGWMNQNGTWYYLYGNGKMATGWLQLNGTWYYLDGNGAMLTGKQIIGGNVWYFDRDGVWMG